MSSPTRLVSDRPAVCRVERRVLELMGRAMDASPCCAPTIDCGGGLGRQGSLCLLHALVAYRRRAPFPYELTAATIEQGKLVDSFVLPAFPLFVLAGALMESCGIGLLRFLGRPAPESGSLCRDGGGSRTGRPPSKGAKVGFAPSRMLECNQ